MKWQKVPSVQKCLSLDPDDCLVWTLKETDPVYEYITVVRQVKKVPPEDIVWEYYVKFIPKANQKNYANTEWREVLCNSQITDSVLEQLNKSLYDHGQTNVNPNWSTMESQTTDALIQFQKDHALPIGNLDFETLDALGVSY